MIIIGEGPDASLVINFSKQNNWVHYLGAITGDKRVPFFSVSKLLLMPGLVGLVVLDSFALETPMVTTNIPIHSPEFDYLSNGLNGVVTRHDVDEYSQTVADILSNEQKYLALLEGCQTSSEQFTVENMAANFADGLISSLGGEQGYLT